MGEAMRLESRLEQSERHERECRQHLKSMNRLHSNKFTASDIEMSHFCAAANENLKVKRQIIKLLEEAFCNLGRGDLGSNFTEKYPFLEAVIEELDK